MRNSIVLALILLCFLTGCTSNGGYHGESLESIKSRHEEMVQGYKYGSAAQGYYDESLEAEAGANSGDDGGDRYLLAIGVGHYRELPNLEGASREARMFAMTLKKDYGFKVKVLSDPTRAEILVTVKHYREMLRKDSQLVVYYAGHGWKDESSGQGYWLPQDAQIDSRENWLSSTDITAAVRAMAAEDVMIIADSCYQASLQPSSEEAQPSAGHPHPVAAQKVRVVLTSGTIAPAEGETASDCSAFTEALLETLQNSRGPVKGADLYVAVKSKTAARKQPSPRYGIIPDSGHQGGDFVFVPLANRNVDMNSN
jgi:hypothetical protein